jgi:hypothetical protein
VSAHQLGSWRRAIVLASVAMSLALGGCTSNSGSSFESGNWNPFASRDVDVLSKRSLSGRAVTPQDLIDQNGRCAGDPVEPASSPQALQFQAGPETSGTGSVGSPAANTPTASGIALEMTECEVVRVAGPTDQIQIGAGERGQRTTVLTYAQGPHPGIYRFVGGRLVSIERGPEPPTPQKPAKTKKPARAAAHS